MKLLLVNAISGKTTREEKCFPPLGLGYIAAYLLKNMKSIEIKISDENIKEELVTFKPDVVGISSLSQNFGEAKRTSKICKDLGIPVIVGGRHISALPSCLTPDMDLAVLGEGEATMLELMREFQENGMDMKRMSKIPGIAYREEGGTLVFSQRRDPITPLDGLPFPARDLLAIKKQESVHLLSSRGCPYKCRYCASTIFWEGVRFFSPEYVVEELKRIISAYLPHYVYFYDDLFIANKKRLSKIVDLIKKEELNKKVEYFVTLRANLVDEETVRLLKEMNVVSTNIGLESGNARILKHLKNKITLEDNIRAIQIMKHFKLNIGGSFIIGSPDETKEEILETLAFIKNNNIASTSNVYILTPLPGTYFWEYAFKKGMVTEDMDWKKLSIESNLNDKIIIAEQIDKKELFELYSAFKIFRKRAYFVETAKTLFMKYLRNPLEIILSLYRLLGRMGYNQKECK